MRGSHSFCSAERLIQIQAEKIKAWSLSPSGQSSLEPRVKWGLVFGSTMSHLPKDWRFLRSAWLLAAILSGSSTKATELLDSVFNEMISRHDVVTSWRRRRLFFAKLLRESSGLPRLAEADFTGPSGLFSFHELQEPGRSALVLLYFRFFAPEQLANVIGRAEKDLPGILANARAELAQKLPASA